MRIAEGYPRPLSIETVLKTLSDAPIATSRGRGWGGVTLDLHAHISDCSILSPAHDHHLVCYCPAGSGRIVQGRAGALHDGIFSAGMSLVMPAGCDSSWEGSAPASARIRVPDTLIAAAAEQLAQSGAARFEIRNVFERRDETIAHIARVLLHQLDQPAHAAQPFIAETLSCALAAHLLRSYNVFELSEPDVEPALDRLQIARLSDFIHANLDRSIGLSELAAEVNISRFHFSRLFKKTTGTTPLSFVEQCRLQYAQSLITGSDAPLAEIAAMTGFADQSHFTRRFRRHLGCTPAVFARQMGRRRPARSSGR